MPAAVNTSINAVTGKITETVIPWTKPMLRAMLAEFRYGRETAGISIEGQAISTEREEMPVWQGMLFDVVMNPGVRDAYEYKPRNGDNVSLTVAQVKRAYECFAWYVSACFAYERMFAEELQAATDSPEVFDAFAVQMLDQANWPQTEFLWELPQ